MNEMVERMAEAYWNAGKVVKRWADEDEDQRGVVRERMRAAIEAMREPTKIQRYVGNRFVGAHLDDGIGQVIWENMIDAGLRQK